MSGQNARRFASRVLSPRKVCFRKKELSAIQLLGSTGFDVHFPFYLLIELRFLAILFRAVSVVPFAKV